MEVFLSISEANAIAHHEYEFVHSFESVANFPSPKDVEQQASRMLKDKAIQYEFKDFSPEILQIIFQYFDEDEYYIVPITKQRHEVFLSNQLHMKEVIR